MPIVEQFLFFLISNRIVLIMKQVPGVHDGEHKKKQQTTTKIEKPA